MAQRVAYVENGIKGLRTIISRYGRRKAMYAVAYAIGNVRNQFWKEGFESLRDAEEFRLKQPALIWLYYEKTNEGWKVV